MTSSVADELAAALANNTTISSLVGDWNGNASVHTRRPAPADAPFPMIIVYLADVGDDDPLDNLRPIMDYDILIYGEIDHYRTVEQLGFLVRDLFHRQRFIISPNDAKVARIVCRGPMIAPVDNASRIGRLVNLSVTLQQ